MPLIHHPWKVLTTGPPLHSRTVCAPPNFSFGRLTVRQAVNDSALEPEFKSDLSSHLLSGTTPSTNNHSLIGSTLWQRWPFKSLTHVAGSTKWEFPRSHPASGGNCSAFMSTSIRLGLPGESHDARQPALCIWADPEGTNSWRLSTHHSPAAKQ